MLSMWSCNNISHFQDYLFIFLNPTHKTETRPIKCRELLIATHLDQSNHLRSAFCQPHNPVQKCWAPILHVFNFLHPKFATQCTGGVALTVRNLQ